MIMLSHTWRFIRAEKLPPTYYHNDDNNDNTNNNDNNDKYYNVLDIKSRDYAVTCCIYQVILQWQEHVIYSYIALSLRLLCECWFNESFNASRSLFIPTWKRTIIYLFDSCFHHLTLLLGCSTSTKNWLSKNSWWWWSSEFLSCWRGANIVVHSIACACCYYDC